MKIHMRLKDMNVYHGRHLRSSGGEKFGISKKSSHPEIDLLLMRLDLAATFTATVSPVCLPNADIDSPSPGHK